MIDVYQLHDFLSVRVISRNRFLREGYQHYFRYFQTSTEKENRWKYCVQEYSAFRLPPLYDANGPYLNFSSGFCIPKEHYAVVVNNGTVEEYTTYANRATNMWLQTLLVPQGASLVHGAGVRMRGKGVVFAGFGGVGKTSLISALKKRSDFLFFGDDYVFVTEEGVMVAYPADFSIYPYHVVAFPELRGTSYVRYLRRRKIFRLWYDCKRAANFVWRRLDSHGRILFPGWNAPGVKVPSLSVVPQEHIGSHVPLTTGVFLTRYEGDEVQVEEISVDDLVDMLVGNLQIEFQHALPYLYALGTFSPFDVVDFFSKQRSVLEHCVRGIKRFRISIPIHASADHVTESILKSVDRIL